MNTSSFLTVVQRINAQTRGAATYWRPQWPSRQASQIPERARDFDGTVGLFDRPARAGTGGSYIFYDCIDTTIA